MVDIDLDVPLGLVHPGGVEAEVGKGEVRRDGQTGEDRDGRKCGGKEAGGPSSGSFHGENSFQSPEKRA